jgi:ectoine hydroxylase-related dioxygenase (phytanoyl-CoA dioxygenase family)
MAIVSAILGEPNPWLYQYKTNRYTPVHEGVKKHTDGFGGLVPAHQTQAMAIFLDDISAESGALTYVPRTHLLYYTDREPPKDSAPSKEDLDNGEYIPLEVKPGSVLFRVPEMWHAVIPIHHLRRYVTAAYVRKSNTSETCQKKVAESVEQRKEIDTSRFPPEILRMWDYWD